MSSRKKGNRKSGPSPRDVMIVQLRTQGYTYGAIAHELFKAGLTATEVSTVRMVALMKRAAPHLMGAVKHRERLPKLIHKRDIQC
jgi:hypothetical protein